MERVFLIKRIEKDGRLKVKVKPDCNFNAITGFDDEEIRVDIAAPADKDKANKEVIKFFSKLIGKQVRIASGLRSKEKVLELI